MAQIAKMEVQAEIKASADKFYEIFLSKGYLLPKMCPNVIKDLQVIQGDWGSVGSVKQWTYFAADNVSEVSRETIEAIDEKSKSVTFRTVGGQLAKCYKSFKATVQVTPKVSGGCSSSSVKWTVEYEKLTEGVPVPHKYMDFLVLLTNNIDAHLLNNKLIN
ncbi:MLP-like protein 28 [Pyrus x bretschneideri]|uniref:MLP-like protein 28 n=1 Tax=Pyrus x bretschneideri TaxID=225117 RepID=UPI00051098CF|nr:MLP-like protein 28 [Pyrus x bretschneideri]